MGIEKDFPALIPEFVAESVVQDIEAFLAVALKQDRILSAEAAADLVAFLCGEAERHYAISDSPVRKDIRRKSENACRDELRTWLEHWACAEWKKHDPRGFTELQRIGFGWTLRVWGIRTLTASLWEK